MAAGVRVEGRLEGPGSGEKGSVSVASFGAVGDGKADDGRTSFVGCHFYHPEGLFVPKGYVAAGHPAVYL